VTDRLSVTGYFTTLRHGCNVWALRDSAYFVIFFSLNIHVGRFLREL